MEISVEIDGRVAKLDVEPRALLGQVLRDDAAIDQVRLDCETSSCGACTVLLGGVPVKSCAVLAVMADGESVTSAAGLGHTETEAAISRTLGSSDVLPCGECRHAVTVVATAVAREEPRPSREALARALSGTMCRCTGHGPVVDAVVRACEQASA